MKDDKSLKLKARIAPHGNEVSARGDLRLDCAMFSSIGYRIIASLSSLYQGRLSKIDVKAAFLQTG